MKLLNYIFFVGIALGFCACDDDEVKITPAVSFEEASVSVAENAGYLEVPLTLTTTLTKDATIYFAIKEGSVSGGREGAYASCPSYIVLGADAVRGKVRLGIIDNDYPNEDCSFELVITKVEGGAIAAAAGQSCRITIQDDDSKQKVSVGFDTIRMDADENTGILEVPVTVKGLLSDYLTFSVEATDGTAKSTGADPDYKLLTPEVKVVEGESWGVVNVELYDGKAMKADRSFKLKITGVAGCVEGDTTVGIRQAFSECEVTIKKVVRKLMFADSVILVNESVGKTVDFSVALTAPVDRPVTVSVAPKAGATAIEGVHYRMASRELTIPRGETVATTQITIINDTIGNSNRSCDFEIIQINGDVELVEGSRSRLVIENDDSSLGFAEEKTTTFKSKKLLLPIRLNGLHDKRVVMDLEPVVAGNVKEFEHFMILSKKIEIAAGDSVVYAEVQVMNVDEFDFGVRIAAVEVEGLNNKVYREKGKQVHNIHVTTVNDEKLDLPSIAEPVYASSESPAGEGPNNGMASHLIDGDENSYWHAKWAGGDTDDGTRPFTLIYKLDKSYTYGKVEVVPRPGKAGDLTKVIIDVSDDQENWKRLITLTTFSTDVDVENLVGGQYVRLHMIGQNGNENGVVNAAELYLWALR